MPEKSNRERILYILKILYEQTDKENPISTVDLIKTLEEKYGITTFRTTIPRDIEALVEFGFDVKTTIVPGVSSSYYLLSRQFSIPELKMLIDAVAAARFISEEKSAKLIQKLKNLASVNQAKALSGSMVVAGNIKPENQQIYVWIDELQKAINKGTQVILQYYEYNQKKQLVLKHDGLSYNFSPYALAWSDEFYYVIGYSEKHEKVVKFRIDRIATLKQRRKKAVPCPDNFELSRYVSKVFGMYDGEMVKVKLLCTNQLMKTIIDRFGSSVATETVDRKHFKATVEAAISPNFYGWVFCFGGDMRILSPESVCDEFKKMLSKFN